MNPPHSPHKSPAGAAGQERHPAGANAARGLRKKGKNKLLALGSAAVLAVYFAGYYRTRAAAQRFEGDAPGRRSSGSPATIAATPAATQKPATLTPTPASPPPASPANSSSSAPTTLPAPTHAVVTTPALSPALALSAQVTPPSPAPIAPSAPAAPAPLVATTPPPPVSPAVNTAPIANAAAPANTATTAKTADAPQSKWKDGKFSGWGSCRHGDLEATVEIKGGRIVSAIVSTCRTRYSSDVIDRIIPQVVARQSADVDAVSGATQSSDAFYWAVTAALASAKPETAKAL